MADDRIERVVVTKVELAAVEPSPPYNVMLWLQLKDRPTIELRFAPKELADLEKMLQQVAIEQLNALQAGKSV